MCSLAQTPRKEKLKRRRPRTKPECNSLLKKVVLEEQMLQQYAESISNFKSDRQSPWIHVTKPTFTGRLFPFAGKAYQE